MNAFEKTTQTFEKGTDSDDKLILLGLVLKIFQHNHSVSVQKTGGLIKTVLTIIYLHHA